MVVTLLVFVIKSSISNSKLRLMMCLFVICMPAKLKKGKEPREISPLTEVLNSMLSHVLAREENEVQLR
jgi:hypothetical protein